MKTGEGSGFWGALFRDSKAVGYVFRVLAFWGCGFFCTLIFLGRSLIES